VTKQLENKDKAEQKVSKDELSEQQLDKASGGIHFTKTVDKASATLFINCAPGPSHK
jgi:type VI protein secretion system component Hcp